MRNCSFYRKRKNVHDSVSQKKQIPPLYLKVTQTRTRSSLFSLFLSHMDSQFRLSGLHFLRLFPCGQQPGRWRRKGMRRRGRRRVWAPLAHLPRALQSHALHVYLQTAQTKAEHWYYPQMLSLNRSYFPSGAQAGQSPDVLRPPKPPSLDPLFLCYSYGTLKMCFQQFTPYREFQERKVKNWWLRFISSPIRQTSEF